MELDITYIKKLIDDILKKYGIKTNELYTDEDGNYVYYMNGNDGTDFDYIANNRSCEFFVFYKDTEMGVLKLYAEQRGLHVYVFDKEEPNKVLENVYYSPKDLNIEYDFEEVCGFLYGSFDQRGTYDMAINDWVLTDCNIIETEEEDEINTRWTLY